MKCLKCNDSHMVEIYELPNHEPMDDHYCFQCPECKTIEKIHYYTYEAMMDYMDYVEEARLDD